MKKKAVFVPNVIKENKSFDIKLEHNSFLTEKEFGKLYANKEKYIDYKKIKELDSLILKNIPEKFHDKFKINSDNKQIVEEMFDIDLEEFKSSFPTLVSGNFSSLMIYVMSDIIKRTYFDNLDIFFVDISKPFDWIYKNMECELHFEIGLYHHLCYPLRNYIAIERQNYIDNILLKKEKLSYKDLKELREFLSILLTLMNHIKTKMEIKKNNYERSLMHNKRESHHRYMSNSKVISNLLDDRIDTLSQTSKRFEEIVEVLLKQYDDIEKIMKEKWNWKKIIRFLASKGFDKLPFP